MKLFIALTCIFAVNANIIHDNRIQQYNQVKIENRIINGSLADIKIVPWQVSILYQSEGEEYVCGGSLIHPKFVLTAAHCVNGASLFRVRFGSNNVEHGGIARITDTFIMHEKYDPVLLYNDIALLYIQKSIKLSDTIKTIPLPSPGEYIDADETLWTSGFGNTLNGPQNNLYYIKVASITNQECSRHFNLQNTQLCCKAEDIKSTCKGDSGGPLVKYTENEVHLVGITSFVSKEGCHLSLPFGFVRVESYLDWISNAMKKFA